MDNQEAHISADLEKRLLGGDEAAMKQVFESYYSRLHYFALQSIKVPEEAQDIVAEAFLNFWTNIREGKVIAGNLQAYLYRMVRNRCLNYLQRRHMIEGKTPEIIEQLYRSQQEQMDETILQAELFNRIKDKFSHLTPVQIQVMQLIYIEGLEIQEIAERLKTTANNVRNHKARAMERLKSVVKDELLISFLLFSRFF